MALPAGASAARGHVFSGHFAEPGTGPGQLTEPAGAAVNEASGQIYVVDKGNDRVERFSSTGAFLGQFDGSGTYEVEGTVETGEAAPTGAFVGPDGIAIDNDPSSPSHGDVYVVDPGHEVVDKFTPTGGYLHQLSPTGTSTAFYGVAVDPHGGLWLYESSFGIEPAAANFTDAVLNEAVATIRFHFEPGFTVPGFAVDSEDDLYTLHTLSGTGPAEGEYRVSEYDSKGKPLREEFAPERTSAVATEAGTGDVYLDNLTTWARFTPAGTELERLPVPAGHGAGIAVDAAAGKVYVANVAEGVIDEYGPEPAGPPTIEGATTSASAVTADAAILEAEINPRSESNEAATSWSFQYLTQAAWEADGGSFEGPETPGVIPLPAGELAPSFEPEPVSARVQGLAAATTYHYRAVARNSHPGQAIGEEATFTTQATTPFALPDGRQWEMVSPPDKLGAALEPIDGEGLIQASADGDAITYLATASLESGPAGNSLRTQVLSRRGAAGWESAGITSPRGTASGSFPGSGQEYRLFSTDLSLSVDQPLGTSGQPFTPLSPAATEPTAYLRTDFPAGNPGAPCTGACYLPLVSAANVPAGTEFGTCAPAQPFCGPIFVGATPDLGHIVLYSLPALVEGAPKGGLYEWSAGQLTYVGQVENRLSFDSISPDGSYVVFDGSSEGLTGLLRRDTVTAQLVRLGTSNVKFQGASADGSYVFYSEGVGGGLFRYDLESGRTTELAAAASVEGLLPGVSADGSVAYFVATADLTGTEEDAAHETAQAGAPNLYLYRDGATSLIAVLSSEDSPDWGNGGARRLNQTARVSPNGRWLAFMSERPLTGYDNRDAASGERDEEVFLYDAEGNGGAGKLVCASCNPTGARPHGIEFHGQVTLITGNQVSWARQWLASTVPTWTGNGGSVPTLYQSRYLSDSGRLFFNSTDALVPQDTNGTSDVYEYEPPGVGSCTTSSPTYASSSGGCVDLISSGTSKEESGFLDASESGDDVFFLTGAQLSRQDTDTSLDLYDAHVCSGEAPCFPEPPASKPECDGDACQQPAVPPVDATPGSLTFSGAGNVVECPKGKVKKAGKCVKKKAAKKKNGHKKHKGKNKKKNKSKPSGKGQKQRRAR